MAAIPQLKLKVDKWLHLFTLKLQQTLYQYNKTNQILFWFPFFLVRKLNFLLCSQNIKADLERYHWVDGLVLRK